MRNVINDKTKASEEADRDCAEAHKAYVEADRACVKAIKARDEALMDYCAATREADRACDEARNARDNDDEIRHAKACWGAYYESKARG